MSEQVKECYGIKYEVQTIIQSIKLLAKEILPNTKETRKFIKALDELINEKKS